MNIYLDTNILIGGGNRPEHEKIKNWAKSYKLTLYKSIHGDIETHGLVSRALHRKDRLYREFEKSQFSHEGKAKFEAFIVARKEYESLREKEEAENRYWDVAILHLPNTFDAQITTFGFLPDFNVEMPLLNELITKFKILPKDAMHIVSAHSSKFDYFLTWDNELINKGKKVGWLKLKLSTPAEFVAIYEKGTLYE